MQNCSFASHHILALPMPAVPEKVEKCKVCVLACFSIFAVLHCQLCQLFQLKVQKCNNANLQLCTFAYSAGASQASCVSHDSPKWKSAKLHVLTWKCAKQKCKHTKMQNCSFARLHIRLGLARRVVSAMTAKNGKMQKCMPAHKHVQKIHADKFEIYNIACACWCNDCKFALPAVPAKSAKMHFCLQYALLHFFTFGLCQWGLHCSVLLCRRPQLEYSMTCGRSCPILCPCQPHQPSAKCMCL